MFLCVGCDTKCPLDELSEKSLAIAGGRPKEEAIDWLNRFRPHEVLCFSCAAAIETDDAVKAPERFPQYWEGVEVEPRSMGAGARSAFLLNH